MKTLLYITLTAIIILTLACKSIDKLVDQGRYDEAIVLATKKLAGKKNKKTKHIKALEEAFAKVNHRDLEHIAYLKEINDLDAWDNIYDYGLKIDRRQNSIIPFLPLVSNQNYMGSFDLIDIAPIITEAREEAAKYTYDLGVSLLDQAVLHNDKLLAQEAHYTFIKINKYYDRFEDSELLLKRSHSLGTFHVLLKWDFSDQLIFNKRHFAHSLNDNWTKYHTDYTEEIIFDAISSLQITDISISPEREIINNFAENKTLESWEDELDVNGNVLKDSTGQTIKVKIVENISANISEYIRTKDASVSALISTTDFENGDIISQDQLTHNINFRTDAYRISGDIRALENGTRKRIDNSLLPFPSDFVMIDEGLRQMNENFIDHLKDLNISYYYRNDVALK